MKRITLLVVIIISLILIGCQSINTLTPTSTPISSLEVTPYKNNTPIPPANTPVREVKAPNPTRSKSLRNEDGSLSKEIQGGILRRIDDGIRYINEHECFILDFPSDWKDYLLIRENEKFGEYSFYFYGQSKIGQGYKMYDSQADIKLFTIMYCDNTKESIGKVGNINYTAIVPEVNPVDVILNEANNLENDSSSFDNVQEEIRKLDNDINQLIKMTKDVDVVLESFNEVNRQEMGWSYICVRNLIDSLWCEYSNYELIIGDTVYTMQDECGSDDYLTRRLRVDIKDLNRCIDQMTLNVFDDNGEIVEKKTYKNVLIYIQDDEEMFDELNKSDFNAQFLWVSGCSEDSDISEIARFKHLRQLYMEECGNIYDITSIGKLTKLKELSLGGTNLNSYVKFNGLKKIKHYQTDTPIYYAPLQLRIRVMNNHEYSAFVQSKKGEILSYISVIPPTTTSAVMNISTIFFKKNISSELAQKLLLEMINRLAKILISSTNKVRLGECGNTCKEIIDYLLAIDFKKECVLIKEVPNGDLTLYSNIISV